MPFIQRMWNEDNRVFETLSIDKLDKVADSIRVLSDMIGIGSDEMLEHISKKYMKREEYFHVLGELQQDDM